MAIAPPARIRRPSGRYNASIKSLGAARAFAIVWLMNVPAIFALGFAMWGVSRWRDQASRPSLTPVATAAYVEHRRTCHAPPNAVRWHDRLSTAIPTAIGVYVQTSLIGSIIIPNEYIGRRRKASRP